MTTQQECSQFPLMEMECTTTSPPICWVMMVNGDVLTSGSMMKLFVQHFRIITMAALITLQDHAVLLWMLSLVMYIHNALWYLDLMWFCGSQYCFFILGDEVQVVLSGSTNDTPLHDHTSFLYNGFNGFRI